MRELAQIGLSVEYWYLALPGRSEREMLDRRLELELKLAELI